MKKIVVDRKQVDGNWIQTPDQCSYIGGKGMLSRRILRVYQRLYDKTHSNVGTT